VLLLSLAARNLLRNRRRTLITMAGISLGLALMMVSNNIAFGSHNQMLRTAISMMAGHVVVQAEGYQADPSPKRVMADSTAITDQVRAAVPEAKMVTRRIYVDGLLSSPANSVAVAVKGVEPDKEKEVVDIDDKLTDGAWLQDGDKQDILLGASMAESLGVGVGDKVVYMGQPASGEVQSLVFRVRGIFKTGAPEIDGFTVLVPIQAVQGLYERPDVATQISVHLDSDHDTAKATKAVRAALSRPGLEILPWEDAIPDIRDFVKLDSAYGDGIWLVLGIIVAMGVVNTVLMSVLERVRELGVMMAVGMKPGQLARMVLTEGLILGAVSAVIGIIIGLLLTWALAIHGIDLSGEMGRSMEAAGVPISLVLYPEVDWFRLGIYPLVGVGFAFLASLYPAYKVTRLTPVEAIHHQ